ncbi:MAG: hypothetical protein ABEJ57_02020 [Halobacteriaceae archaeon]
MVSLATPVAIVAGVVVILVTLVMLYVTYLGYEQDRHSPGGGELPTTDEAEE